MTKKLTKRDITKYQKTIGTAWLVASEGTELSRTFSFPTFVEALMFVTRVGVHAEVMQDYPHITLHDGIVKLVLTTIEAGGLSKHNFEFAGKVDIVFALSTMHPDKRTSRQ